MGENYIPPQIKLGLAEFASIHVIAKSQKFIASVRPSAVFIELYQIIELVHVGSKNAFHSLPLSDI